MKSYRSPYAKRYCPNCDEVVAHRWAWRYCADCWRMAAKTAALAVVARVAVGLADYLAHVWRP